ncbi:MAG TPA: hypothetical protein VI790_00505, partial [Candidatus Nanoarchaeia archaeon]|nr:hypothetical protein [Candidatus Nanoarchaeia archaeon]
MRGKRGQEVVLRELFSFALGVIIMFLIIVMFNLILAPQIKEFSVNEQAYSMIYHFNSIFENAHESITNLNTDSLALSYELPSDVGGQSYRVFVDAGELCVRTRGDVAILRCTPLNTHATVAGSYLSGTDLSLIVSEQNGEIKVNFNNVAVKYEAYIYYPSCGSLPVVNLNNSATYSADDSFICSCNTKVLENQLYNPSFDEGLNYWYIYTSHPSHLYSFNSS